MDTHSAALLSQLSSRAPPSARAAYVRRLDPSAHAAILSSITYGDGGARLLRAAWPARILHPGIFTSAARGNEAVLAEAECLIGEDVSGGVFEGIGVGAVLESLLTSAEVGRGAARLAVALACGEGGGRRAFARIIEWGAGDTGVLCVVLCVGGRARCGAKLRESVRMALRRGRGGGKDLPEIVRGVLAMVGGRTDVRQWVEIAVECLRKGQGFADLLSVLEWQVGEMAWIAGLVLDVLEGAKVGARDVAVAVSLLRCAPGAEVRRRLIALFASRDAAGICTEVTDSRVVGASGSGSGSGFGGGASGSRSERRVEEFGAIRRVVECAVVCPGMELRCGALLEMGQSLVEKSVVFDGRSATTNARNDIGRWGCDMLVASFVSHEAVRPAILNLCFQAVTEGAGASPAALVWYRIALERLARHAASPALFRSHVACLRKWFSYLGSIPSSVAEGLIASFAPLAARLPVFADFFLVTLRKLTATRSLHAQGIAGAGLISLAVNANLDAAAADEVVAMLISLLDCGALRVRAALLEKLAARLESMPEALRNLPRLEKLHAGILGRVDKLARDGSGVSSGGDVCPLRVETAFTISCGEPALRDAVPELLRYAIATRQASPRSAVLLKSVFDYAVDVRRSLHDVAISHTDAAMNFRWIYVKARLLLFICELLLDVSGVAAVDVQALLRTYSITVSIRDIVVGKMRSSPAAVSLTDLPASVALDRAFNGGVEASGSDMVTAREACALIMSAGHSGASLLEARACAIARQIDRETDWNVAGTRDSISNDVLMTVERLTCCLGSTFASLNEEKRLAMVAACELASALLSAVRQEKKSSKCRIDTALWSRISSLCVSLFCNSHPWLSSSQLQEECGEDDSHSAAGASNVLSGPDAVPSAPAIAIAASVKQPSPAPRRTRRQRSSVARYGLSAGQRGNDSEVHSLSVAETQVEVSTDASRDTELGLHARKNAEESSGVVGADLVRMSRCKHSRQFPLSLPTLIASVAAECQDEIVKSSLEKMESSVSSYECCRIRLRYFALQILLLTPNLQADAVEWPVLIDSIPCNAASDREWSSLHLRKESSLGKQIVLAVLACFEQEFEYSLSTSLSVCYVQFLQRAIRDWCLESDLAAHVGGSVDALEVSSKVSTVSVLTRILTDYTITHSSVLRPMLTLLMESVEPKVRIDFIRIIAEWLGSAPVRKSGRIRVDSDCEDESDGRLSNFDDDIVAAALAMDGVINSPRKAGNVQAEKGSIGEKIGEGGSERNAENQRLVHADAKRSDGAKQRKREAVNLSRQSFVRRLSFRESEECRVASLLVAVLFMDRLVPRRRASLSSDESMWSAQDATDVNSVCSLLSSAWYGVLASEPRAEAVREEAPTRFLPGSVLSKLLATVSSLVQLGRAGSKFFKLACSTRMTNGAEATYAADTVAAVLRGVNLLRVFGDEQKTNFLSEGRVHFQFEQLELDIASSLIARPKSSCMSSAFDELDAAYRSVPHLQSSKRRSRPDGRLPVSSRKKRRIRSRNKAVDEMLDDERGDDNFADMEDFLVERDVCEGL